MPVHNAHNENNIITVMKEYVFLQFLLQTSYFTLFSPKSDHQTHGGNSVKS